MKVKKVLAVLGFSLCLSSAALAETAGTYIPGSLDVRIPKAFMPPPVEIEVEVPLEPGDPGYENPADLAAKNKAARDAAAKNKNTTAIGGQVVDGRLPAATTEDLRNQPMQPLTKKVKKQLPAPSPFKVLSPGDFKWLTNESGHYSLALPKAYGTDPLQDLPLNGPEIVREVGDELFMAATVDDPVDIKYYKNQKTMPSFPGAVPLVTETRPTVQNHQATCVYFNYEMEGTTCLVLRADIPLEGKTYKLLYVFPENQRNSFLPLSLYSLENFRVVETARDENTGSGSY